MYRRRVALVKRDLNLKWNHLSRVPLTTKADSLESIEVDYRTWHESPGRHVPAVGGYSLRHEALILIEPAFNSF